MTQQTQEPQVSLKLSVNQLNVVLSGLIKLPIEIGLETFQLVQQQAQQQLGSPSSAQVPPGPMGSKVVQ